MPVAEVVNEVGVEKWDAVAGEAGTGYVAEFGLADYEAFAHVEDVAVNGLELGNMVGVEDVAAHELPRKSALQGEVAAVG